MAKRRRSKQRLVRASDRGFTLMEILTVVAILAILIIIGLVLTSPHLIKAYDGRRKSDLKALKNAFEDYYSDYNCYPPADTLERYCAGEDVGVLDDYIKKVPCDPETREAYLYMPYPNSSNTCGGYRVYTKLKNDQDKSIEQAHCDGPNGCGIGTGFESYNYAVSEGVAVNCDGNCDYDGVAALVESRPTPTSPPAATNTPVPPATTNTPTPPPAATSTPTPVATATPTPTVTPTPTPVTYALNFPGDVARNVVTTSGTSGLNFTTGDSITLTAWVRPNNIVAGFQEGIVAKGHDDRPKNYRMSIVGTANDVGKLAFYFLNDASPAQSNQYMANVSILENNTYYFVVTFTYGDPNSMRMYVNGSSVSGSWTIGDGTLVPAQVSESVTIGGDTNAGLNEQFNGVIDEVRIYDTAITSTQVVQNYNLGTGVPAVPTTGLVAGWDLNEGTGSSLADFSGNGYTGTLSASQTWTSGLIPN